MDYMSYISTVRLRDMKEMIKNYELELSGSLLMIRVNGDLVTAKEVNPITAVDDYHNLVQRYKEAALCHKI